VLNVAGKRGLTIEEMLKQMKASGLKAPGGLTPVNTIQGLISQHVRDRPARGAAGPTCGPS
jgi:hypothetical protein